MGAGGDLGGTALGKLLAEPRALLRTPPWLPSAKKKPKPMVSAIVDTTKPFPELSFGLQSRASTNPSKRAAQAGLFKQKVKTRDTPMPSTDSRSAVDLSEEHEGLKQHGTIVVDARTLKVFRIVFFQPFLSASPGKVAWKDFVRALVSTEFEAQKLYGSVWQFTPGSNPAASTVRGGPEKGEQHLKENENSKMTRSIQFHNSHLCKIPFHTARRHGRRLVRAYGWHGGMFVEKEK